MAVMAAKWHCGDGSISENIQGPKLYQVFMEKWTIQLKSVAYHPDCKLNCTKLRPFHCIYHKTYLTT